MSDMLRNVTEDEIRGVAAPLWTIINSSSWSEDPGTFSRVRNGAASIVAHLAYCAIDADERERKLRAKVIPCHLYQRLIGHEFDLVQIMRRLDFGDIEVVRTKYFVAVIVPVREFFLIGVRGTQFAYDWLINAKFAKAKGPGGQYFHAGFLGEAQELASALIDRFGNRFKKRTPSLDPPIYLAGHSLGGAIAAILSHLEFVVPSANQMQFELHIDECYMFGAPRISNSRLFLNNPHFATRRYLDIVPHCPPEIFNYADFSDQKTPSGDKFTAPTGAELYFFASWLGGLAVDQFPKNHSMEHYRFEVLEEAKRDASVQRFWKIRLARFRTPGMNLRDVSNKHSIIS